MKRTILYVGGVEESVTEDVLHAAFIPFGPLRSVQLPRNFKENRLRGFAFVEFEEEEDCLDAIDNMDGAELHGKTLRVNLAKPNASSKNSKSPAAVWTVEDFIKEELESAEAGDG